MIKSVCYQDERNCNFKILISSFEIWAEETVLFFKRQRYIKLQFKKIKQFFQQHYFFVRYEDVIYTQFWGILSAQLLISFVQKIAQKKKTFAVLVLKVRLKLVSLTNNFEFLRSNRMEYRNISRGPPVLKKPLE